MGAIALPRLNDKPKSAELLSDIYPVYFFSSSLISFSLKPSLRISSVCHILVAWISCGIMGTKMNAAPLPTTARPTNVIAIEELPSHFAGPITSKATQRTSRPIYITVWPRNFPQIQPTTGAPPAKDPPRTAKA